MICWYVTPFLMFSFRVRNEKCRFWSLLHNVDIVSNLCLVFLFLYEILFQRVYFCWCWELGALHQVFEPDACYVWVSGLAWSLCEWSCKFLILSDTLFFFLFFRLILDSLGVSLCWGIRKYIFVVFCRSRLCIPAIVCMLWFSRGNVMLNFGNMLMNRDNGIVLRIILWLCEYMLNDDLP